MKPGDLFGVRVAGYYVGKEEETECDECGAPVYVGDTAYEWRDASGACVDAGWCCRACATAALVRAEAAEEARTA